MSITRKVVVYNPEARKVHNVESSAATFGELADELGLMPNEFKYVCSYQEPGNGHRKLSLEFETTRLPEVDLNIYFFAKKNVSGGGDVRDTLAEIEAMSDGITTEDILSIVRVIGEMLLEKVEELEDGQDNKEEVKRRIQEIIDELNL